GAAQPAEDAIITPGHARGAARRTPRPVWRSRHRPRRGPAPPAEGRQARRPGRASVSVKKLSRLGAKGEAQMVDVSAKPVTSREARARGVVRMSAPAFEAIMLGNLPKGEVLATARIAGIQAAKRASDLIPMCHPLMLT